MERKIFLIIFILLCSTTKAQQQVSVSTAKTAAITTMKYNKLFYSEDEINAVNFFISEHDTILYEVKFNDNHSVLLSGSLACQPILGYNFSYNDETVLDKFDEIPPGLQSMIQEYIDQIELCFANDTITLWHEKDWADLMSYNKNGNEIYDVVSPLITTKWGQDKSNWYGLDTHIDYHAYNYYVSETGVNCDNTYCPTGCVATAMAQIMNYWKHPVYNPLYGANQLDWCNMPDELCMNSPNYNKERNAVAWLMRKSGIAVDMDYCMDGECQSGAYIDDACHELVHSFGYSGDANIKTRASYMLLWTSFMKYDLCERKPILYRGDEGTNNNGHVFICDGFRSDDTFHFNWGWNGAYHIYWLTLNTLCVGDNNYSSNQKAIFNIHPEYFVDHCDFSMSLEDHFTYFNFMLINRTEVPKTFKILESVSRSSSLPAMYRTIYNNDNIEYVAHKAVILRDGFTAEEGSHFVAYIDECEKCEEEGKGYKNEDESIIENTQKEPSSIVDNKIHIIPNPNNGSFFVSLSNTEEEIIGIRVMDVMGKTVYSDNKFTGGDVVLLNVNHGLYYVTVILKNGAMTEKIVIK